MLRNVCSGTVVIMRPKMIEQLLQKSLVDYFAMDIKAPLRKYNTLCGVNVDIQAIRLTISTIAASTVSHHFRTTDVKPLLAEEDLTEVLTLVPPGSKHITQVFVAAKAWKKSVQTPYLQDFTQEYNLSGPQPRSFVNTIQMTDDSFIALLYPK